MLDSPEIEAVVGHPGARLRIADLALPSGGVLELIQYELPADPPVSTSHTQAGTAHIALQVAGLRELFARLAAAGVDLISSHPVEITGSGEFAGCRRRVPARSGRQRDRADRAPVGVIRAIWRTPRGWHPRPTTH